MRLKLAGLALFFLVVLFSAPAAEANEPGYFKQLPRTLGRGLTNIVTCLWEIPYTIGQYDHKNDSTPRVIRDTAGFFDGVFRTITRLGCGFWDVAFSVIPGDQSGLPLKPETFF